MLELQRRGSRLRTGGEPQLDLVGAAPEGHLEQVGRLADLDRARAHVLLGERPADPQIARHRGVPAAEPLGVRAGIPQVLHGRRVGPGEDGDAGLPGGDGAMAQLGRRFLVRGHDDPLVGGVVGSGRRRLPRATSVARASSRGSQKRR